MAEEQLPDVQAWLQHRDEAAARALMARLHPLVSRIARRNLPFRMTEDDLTQEIYVKLFQNLHRYDARLPLENWVARLALNVCRDHLRARAARPELRWTDLAPGEQRAFEATAHDTGPDAAVASDAKALLHRILETLPADDRLVLTLLHLEEKSVDEIASLTGWSRPLVKVRAFRARGRLKKAFHALEPSQRQRQPRLPPEPRAL